jgi:hypothetical protein
MELVDEERGGVIRFNYDVFTHGLTLADIERDGEHTGVAVGACQLMDEELGMVNPRMTVIRLGIDCPAVEVPGLGSVPVARTVVVWRAAFEN